MTCFIVSYKYLCLLYTVYCYHSINILLEISTLASITYLLFTQDDRFSFIADDILENYTHNDNVYWNVANCEIFIFIVKKIRLIETYLRFEWECNLLFLLWNQGWKLKAVLHLQLRIWFLNQFCSIIFIILLYSLASIFMFFYLHTYICII